MKKIKLGFCNNEWVSFDFSMKQISNSYTFRGPINIPHIVNDCIRDGKQAFIAIGDEVVMGVSKQLRWNDTIFNSLHTFGGSQDFAFYLFRLTRKEIPWAISFLKDIDKKIKKDVRAIAKQIAKDKRAGKFSNTPVTKVLVF